MDTVAEKLNSASSPAVGGSSNAKSKSALGGILGFTGIGSGSRRAAHKIKVWSSIPASWMKRITLRPGRRCSVTSSGAVGSMSRGSHVLPFPVPFSVPFVNPPPSRTSGSGSWFMSRMSVPAGGHADASPATAAAMLSGVGRASAARREFESVMRATVGTQRSATRSSGFGEWVGGLGGRMPHVPATAGSITNSPSTTLGVSAPTLTNQRFGTVLHGFKSAGGGGGG
ncbi:hypothetical protein B0H17DRAFT_1033070, partial [Mycena rosella]